MSSHGISSRGPTTAPRVTSPHTDTTRARGPQRKNQEGTLRCSADGRPARGGKRYGGEGRKGWKEGSRRSRRENGVAVATTTMSNVDGGPNGFSRTYAHSLTRAHTHTPTNSETPVRVRARTHALSRTQNPRSRRIVIPRRARCFFLHGTIYGRRGEPQARASGPDDGHDGSGHEIIL